jgi:MSHA biogenesis protein MshQ
VISLIELPVNAAISLIAETTDSGNDDKASIMVPSDIQSGDVLITKVTFRNRNGSDGVSTPNGWRLIGLQNQDNNILQSVYYKVATSSDVNTSFEWDFDGNVNRRYIFGITAYRGADPTSLIAANASITGAWSCRCFCRGG